jgi:4-amino-4-deoxy-L-arabinose transferase-like glycosyltransferase
MDHGVFSKEVSPTPTPDSYWAPGYPSFLAAILSFSKFTNIDAYKTLLLVQALLGACLAVVTLLVGRLFLTNAWALYASLLVCVSPHLVSMGGYVLTETLFAFVLLASLYFFICASLKRNTQYFVASGVSFGVAYLINPVVLFVPILISLIYVWRYKNEESLSIEIGKICKNVLLVFIIVVSAWHLRNVVNVPENSVTSSDRAYINLVIGSHHNYHEIWRKNPRDPKNPATVDMRRLGGSYLSFFELLMQRFKEQPLHYFKWYLIEKPILLWDWNILTGQGDVFVYPVKSSLYHVSNVGIASHSLMKSMHFWLFGTALFSCIFLYVRRKENESFAPLVMFVTVAAISSVYVIFQSEARYSVPLRPEMYLCAIYFLSSLTQKIKDYKN